MSFEFRVSSFGLSSLHPASILEKLSLRRRADTPIAGISAPEKPETQNPKLETFFDPDFLRQLERLRLIAKRLTWASVKGEHATARRGSSLEFSDYRRYQHGDDLRYVDWNVYRRLDRLLLKVFTAEEEMNVYLLIDTSQSMSQGAPAKIDYARRVGAALGYIGLKNLDRVGGASFSSTLHKPLSLGRGRKQILSLFNFMSRLDCGGETQLRAAVHTFTTLFPQPGFVVILSDLFDPNGWRAALEELTTKRYQVLTIHLVEDHELAPDARGEVALRDIEGGRERNFFIDEALARRYKQELERYFTEIESVCAARHVDYLRTTTTVPFDQFVLQTLRRVSSVA